MEEQNVEDTVVTSGRVTFDDAKVAHVFSPVNGRVTEIYAKLGEHVKKGQPLAAIQSPDIGQAVSDVHKAEADLTAAEHDYKRQKDLEKQHAAATRDVEASEDRYRQAKAELERAQAKANLLRAGLGEHRDPDLHPRLADRRRGADARGQPRGRDRGAVRERHRGGALHRRRDRPRLGDRRRVRGRHPPGEEGRARRDQGRLVQGQALLAARSSGSSTCSTR